MGNAVGLHLGDHIGDIRVPVPHANVDGGKNLVFEEQSLPQRPACQRRPLGKRCLAQPDLGVAVLQLFDHRGGHWPPAGNFGEILGHLAEDVRCAVREEQDGVGVGHA